MAHSRACTTALVTGASGGVGSVLVNRFVNQGMRVVAAVRDASAARASAGVGSTSIVYLDGDVTDESSVRGLFAKAARELGNIDLMVNTVGGYLPQTDLANLETDAWDGMMSVNLRSAFLCTREAIRTMKVQGHGVIVNFSAWAGLHPSPGRIPYAVAKSGIALLTRVAAEEVRGTGIALYAIAPGTIATDANRTWGSSEEQSRWVTPLEIAEEILILAQGSGAASGSVIMMGDRP